MNYLTRNPRLFSFVAGAAVLGSAFGSFAMAASAHAEGDSDTTDVDTTVTSTITSPAYLATIETPAQYVGFADANGLTCALEGGSSWTDLAANAGHSRDDLIAFLTTVKTNVNKAAVAAGTMTQDASDADLTAYTAALGDRIDDARVPQACDVVVG